MLAARLYEILWMFIHLLASAFETVCWLRRRLTAAAQWSYDHFRSRELYVQEEQTILRQCKQQLTKIPHHLSIIVGPLDKLVDEELLARLFRYAAFMNIDCISILDVRDINKSAAQSPARPVVDVKSTLNLKQMTLPNGISLKQHQDDHWIWLNESNIKQTNAYEKPVIANGHSNGYNKHSNGTLHQNEKNNYTLEIYEVRPKHCHHLLAEVCCKLFQQRSTESTQKLLENRMHLMQHINAELSKELQFKFPEPELCLIFSQQMCTFGMLPWHTRFTEFQLHENGSCFNVKNFTNMLFKFSKCEQRWGK